MADRALVIGGTGLIGRALTALLVRKGWDVTSVSRGRPEAPTTGVSHVRVDRADQNALKNLVSQGYDVLFDIVALSSRDADRLEDLGGAMGSIVLISTAAVYADASGASLLNSSEPRPLPITEMAPTVPPAPDDSNYPAVKRYIEARLLDAEPAPITVLRPGAIFGPGDRASREWYFAKRVLDHRPHVVLADNGQNVFHQVASENLARLALLAAERPATRILNAGDEAPRTILETGRAIATAMGHTFEEVLLESPPLANSVGETPWSTPFPFVLDISAARELGYRDASPPAALMRETCEWLVDATSGGDWRVALPTAARHYGGLFDYEAEDEVVTTLGRGRDQ